MGHITLYLNRFWFADAPEVTPPMPPSEGRFDVFIDNDAITRLDLSPFQSATGMKDPLSGKENHSNLNTLYWDINNFLN